MVDQYDPKTGRLIARNIPRGEMEDQKIEDVTIPYDFAVVAKTQLGRMDFMHDPMSMAEYDHALKHLPKGVVLTRATEAILMFAKGASCQEELVEFGVVFTFVGGGQGSIVTTLNSFIDIKKFEMGEDYRFPPIMFGALHEVMMRIRTANAKADATLGAYAAEAKGYVNLYRKAYRAFIQKYQNRPDFPTGLAKIDICQPIILRMIGNAKICSSCFEGYNTVKNLVDLRNNAKAFKSFSNQVKNCSNRYQSGMDTTAFNDEVYFSAERKLEIGDSIDITEGFSKYVKLDVIDYPRIDGRIRNDNEISRGKKVVTGAANLEECYDPLERYREKNGYPIDHPDGAPQDVGSDAGSGGAGSEAGGDEGATKSKKADADGNEGGEEESEGAFEGGNFYDGHSFINLEGGDRDVKGSRGNPKNRSKRVKNNPDKKTDEIAQEFDRLIENQTGFNFSDSKKVNIIQFDDGDLDGDGLQLYQNVITSEGSFKGAQSPIKDITDSSGTLIDRANENLSKASADGALLLNEVMLNKLEGGQKQAMDKNGDENKNGQGQPVKSSLSNIGGQGSGAGTGPDDKKEEDNDGSGSQEAGGSDGPNKRPNDDFMDTNTSAIKVLIENCKKGTLRNYYVPSWFRKMPDVLLNSFQTGDFDRFEEIETIRQLDRDLSVKLENENAAYYSAIKSGQDMAKPSKFHEVKIGFAPALVYPKDDWRRAWTFKKMEKPFIEALLNIYPQVWFVPGNRQELRDDLKHGNFEIGMMNRILEIVKTSEIHGNYTAEMKKEAVNHVQGQLNTIQRWFDRITTINEFNSDPGQLRIPYPVKTQSNLKCPTDGSMQAINRFSCARGFDNIGHFSQVGNYLVLTPVMQEPWTYRSEVFNDVETDFIKDVYRVSLLNLILQDSELQAKIKEGIIKDAVSIQKRASSRLNWFLNEDEELVEVKAEIDRDTEATAEMCAQYFRSSKSAVSRDGLLPVIEGSAKDFAKGGKIPNKVREEKEEEAKKGPDDDDDNQIIS